MESLLQYKAVLLASFALAIVILERLFPAARPLLKTKLATARAMAWRIAKNLVLLLINAGLSPLLVIPLSIAAADFAPQWRPEWTRYLIIDLLVLDLWIYWWHRANHVVPLFWRFHQVHHLDEFLDASSAVRFHFGEVVLSACVRAAVIFALAIPVAAVVVFETLVLASALFHHSNIRLAPALENALSKVLVTPSLHWLHHHAVRADTDSNYSSLLSVWDRVFASRSRNLRRLDMPIGVESLSDEPLLPLLMRPFRRIT